MPSTLIKDGSLLRQTRRIPLARAKSFARMLERDPRQLAIQIRVVNCGRSEGVVEFCPRLQSTIGRFVGELQGARALRANDVRKYRWRRVKERVWRCWGPMGQEYTIWLDGPQCTCPDWLKVRSAGCQCKHIICAQEAERRYQADVVERRRAA